MRSKVLVVEDSPTQAETLVCALDAAGFEAVLATSGEVAVERLEQERFDIVVSDVVMPGISGYDLCRLVKSRFPSQEIPVVLLTSLTDPMAIIRGLECSADNYVTKPYTPEHLITRIRHALDKYSLRPERRTSVGVNVSFLGSTFVINSDREQILDLFLSSIEDVVRTNEALLASQRQLAEAKNQLQAFASKMQHEASINAEKYATLMQSAAAAILVLDGDGRIEEANQRAAELLGETADKLRGRSLTDFVHPEARTLLESRLGQTPGAAVGAPDIEFQDRSNRRLFFDVTVSRTPTEAADSALVILHDVTERKSLEEQLRQSQKLEAIGQLAGGIAHDFNNLLTVITSYSEITMAALEADSPLRADVAQIRRAGESAASLTRQLLAFSRKQIIKPQLLSLGDVTRGLQRMLERLLGEDITLTVDLDSSDGRVMADPGQIEQIVLNLAVNARDAMSTGGCLTIRTSRVDVPVGGSALHPDLAPGSYEVLMVRDAGSGMDRATQDRIFEPFFTTKPQGQGTGLGLSTVYGITKQSGGEISVTSAPGQGSTFSVFLPRVAEGATESPSNGSAAPRPVSRRRPDSAPATILLVEDARAVRSILARVLRKEGYEVIEASNGAEAVSLAGRFERAIQVVVTDVVMPELSGPAMIEQISAKRKGLKVIYVSGYTHDDMLRRGLADPGVMFLPKPFGPRQLLQMVREVVG